ncbi:hypothetical protein M5X00_24255 [Paenibacillus alvei]|uniref:Conjugative transposon membrane protein n=2 Tax=Paenibacillus alvei TaxID=44250 RepID=A0ABT4H7F8_PAEAL|nr:hypothetical protein [Paenibacillus alvei]MCY9757343.1 hypothetical protein [Paenibacillus alvei]MCY9764917.1 hypothetical protein [Paenibacillus alvei]MCY9771019.1 hypothetical protein [Paenibacillus alvei]
MKRVAVLFFILITFVGYPVQASPLQDGLIPQDPRTHMGNVELEFNRYPNSRYNVDLWIDATWNPLNVVGHVSDELLSMQLSIINTLWSFDRMVFNFSIKIVGEAYSLDIVDMLVQYIGEGIQTIAGFTSGGFQDYGLWPALILLIITVTAAWASYVFILKREQSKAMSGLVSMLIIFVLSLGYFSNASLVLSTVNGASKELQNRVLSLSGTLVNPGKSYSAEEGLASIQNQMFDLMIKKPYLLMQYGTTSVDPARVDSILALDYNSEGRNQIIKEEVTVKNNQMMGSEGLADRLSFVLLQLVAGGILAVQMILLSGSVLFFQIMFIAFVMFSPVPLLISLVPAWRDTATSWAMKTLHNLLMKVGIALLMTIIFTVAGLLYNVLQKNNSGFLFIIFGQIVAYVGIWIKRKELFSFVARISGSNANSGSNDMLNYMKWKNASKLVKGAFKGSKNFVQSNPKGGSTSHPPVQRESNAVSRGMSEAAASREQQPESNIPDNAGVTRKLTLVPGSFNRNTDDSTRAVEQSTAAPTGALEERDGSNGENGQVRQNTEAHAGAQENSIQTVKARRKTSDKAANPVLRVSRNADGKMNISNTAVRREERSPEAGKKLAIVPGSIHRNADDSTRAVEQSTAAPTGAREERDGSNEENGGVRQNTETHAGAQEQENSIQTVKARRKTSDKAANPVLRVSRNADGKMNISNPAVRREERNPEDVNKREDLLQKSPRYFHEAKKYTEVPLPEPPPPEERNYYEPDDMSWDNRSVESLRAEAIQKASGHHQNHSVAKEHVTSSKTNSVGKRREQPVTKKESTVENHLKRKDIDTGAKTEL